MSFSLEHWCIGIPIPALAKSNLMLGIAVSVLTVTTY